MHEINKRGRVPNLPEGTPSSHDAAIGNSAAPEPSLLDTFRHGLTAAVIGASGGIGGAFAELLGECPTVETVIRLSRNQVGHSPTDMPWFPADLEDERSIADAATSIDRAFGHLDLVIVATGILHDGDHLQPEKSWRALASDSMAQAYRINAIGPALVAKHFLPLLATNRKTAFAALTARVGSIEDNRLGGWYAYRASKAALNMILKTLSIELARRNPSAICVGLHPGTVDTQLSGPFQRGVPGDKLFTPRGSAWRLLNVINTLSPEQSGRVFAWDGKPIAA
jgi:NAD(P)-dependent dehydrogenase (short-subunit alcohol dehydrogenase family)